MKQVFNPFVNVFLISFVLLALGFHFSVKTIDPRGNFGRQIFPLVVSNPRAEKMKFFLESKRDYETFLLCSSRCHRMDPDYMSRQFRSKTFNFSVNSARAEDFLAITRLIFENNTIPIKNLILAVDPSTFGPFPEYYFDHRLFHNKVLWDYADVRLGKKKIVPKPVNIYSWQFLRDSFISLYLAISGSKDYGFVEHGKIVDRTLRTKSSDQVKKEVIAKGMKAFDWENLTVLSQDRIDLVKKIVDLGQRFDVDILFLIMPYSPGYIAHANEETRKDLWKSQRALKETLEKFLGATRDNVFIYIENSLFNGVDDYSNEIHPGFQTSRALIDALAARRNWAAGEPL